MHEHGTLLPPEARSDERGLSSSLPADLLEQVRGRVRLLALLLLVAFSFDPLVYFGMCLVATPAFIAPEQALGRSGLDGRVAAGTVDPLRAGGTSGARRARALLPGQRPHRAASTGEGAVQPAGGPRVVDQAPTSPGLI
jgi:hypothetical protein